MVSAIILNYLNPSLTEKSVNHLMDAAAQTDISVEAVVVDNSAQETAGELHKRLPDSVTVIENEENTGFPAANNQGIEQAEGETILIMNNDLFMNGEALKKGLEHITSNKKTGVWAPGLVYENGKYQRSCARFPTLASLVSEYLFNFQLGNRLALKANKADHPVQADTVIAACMFIRKEIFDEVGLFDPEYFFGCCDVDLCLRIKQAGYDVIFDPRCNVVHLEGTSQNSYWHEHPYLHESRKLYHKNHFNSLHAVFAGVIIDTGIAVRKIKHKLFKG